MESCKSRIIGKTKLINSPKKATKVESLKTKYNTILHIYCQLAALLVYYWLFLAWLLSHWSAVQRTDFCSQQENKIFERCVFQHINKQALQSSCGMLHCPSRMSWTKRRTNRHKFVSTWVFIDKVLLIRFSTWGRTRKELSCDISLPPVTRVRTESWLQHARCEATERGRG